MSLFDTVMSDTVGTLYRAATGKVDPWTQNEITDNAVSDCIKAGGNPADCQTQQAATVGAVVNSQPSLTWWQAFQQTYGTDNGSGCGVTNLGGCVPFDPTYLPYIAVGVGALLLLWLIRPFVVAVEE